MTHQFIAGIDIGGTKIAFGIAAADQEIIARNSLPTDVCHTPEVSMVQVLESLQLTRQDPQLVTRKEVGHFNLPLADYSSSRGSPGWKWAPTSGTIRPLRRRVVGVCDAAAGRQ